MLFSYKIFPKHLVVSEFLFIFGIKLTKNDINMRRILLSLLVFFVSVIVVNAGKVTEQQALQKAQKFMKGKNLSVVKTKASSRSGESTYADAFYIFNAENEGGFVIVSSDDRTASILGYSLNGKIDLSHAPENFVYWMESYIKQMKALPSDYSMVSTRGTRSGMEAIAPLIETTWNQSQPYNLMCPIDDGKNCVTGCVAVALAQVMYYHKWPKTSPAIPGYTTNTKRIKLDELPPTTFKWDQMRTSYGYDETDEAADAVAELLRYCGQINEMDYTKGESAAGLHKNQLISLFGYSKNMQIVYRDEYTNSQWDQMIYNELYNRRPVLYSGASATSGHQFVCDGYDGAGRFHLNWGWGGSCDGYFILSLANPDEKGIGGGSSSDGYAFGQSAVVGFMPSTDHEELIPRLRSYGVGVEVSEYNRAAAGQDFENVQLAGYITANYNVAPVSEFNVETGWGLYQKDKFVTCIRYVANTLSIEQYSGFNNGMTLSFGSDIADGKYQIYQIYRRQGETEWHICINTTYESLVAEINGTQLNIRKIDSETANYVIDDVAYSQDPEIGSPLEITVKLTNKGETVQHMLYFWALENGVWAQKTKGIAYLDEDESGESLLSFIPNVEGTFDVKITSDEVGNDVKSSGSITIANVVQVTVNDIIYSLNLLTNNAKVIASNRDKLKSTVVIPSTVSYNEVEFSVKSILPEAFFNSGSIVNLVISEGIQSIGGRAFEYCFQLESVDIPSSIIKIEDYAFGSCGGLTSVISRMTNPNAIKDNVFERIVWSNNVSTKVKTSATLYVPVGSVDNYKSTDGWKQFGTIYEGELKETTIEGMTYSYVTGSKIATLKYGEPSSYDLTIPSSVDIDGVSYPVIAIARDAFWNKNILSVIIPEGIRSIGYSAFKYCYRLESVELPSSLVLIDDYAFGNCNDLSSVVSHAENPIAISDNVFGKSQWNEDYTVETITPSSATLYVPVGSADNYKSTDGWKLFGTIYEGELKEVTIDDITYNYVTGSKVATLLNGAPSSSNLTIPSTILVDGVIYPVTAISQDAFWNKNNIETLIISEGIKTIGDGAFKYCFGLQTIELPSSLAQIGDYAFGSCKKLVSVVSKRHQPIVISNNVFGNSQWNEDYTVETITPSSATLYVPYGSKDDYAQAEGWSDFKNIIEMGETAAITIGKSGKASYCGDKSLDFSFSEEIKAYIATGYDKDAEIIWLTRVKDVPAGMPVLIKGEANKTYNVPVTDSQNSYYTNMFVGNTTGATIQIHEKSDDGSKLNFYLKDGTFKSVSGNATIGNNKCYLQLPATFNDAVTGESQTVTIKASGKASFAAPVDLDFTNVEGLKAFTATGYDKSTKTIWLTRVLKVQQGEGVLLKGDPNSYEIPSAAAQSHYENMFIGNTTGNDIQIYETSADGSQTNFYLKDGTFKSVSGNATIKNNKCYLALPTSMVAAGASTRSAEENYKFEEPEMIKLPISFRSLGNDGDGTTGIKVQSSMSHVQSDAYYTLQGQRVAKPGKGLYIKNGKKVIVK